MKPKTTADATATIASDGTGSTARNLVHTFWLCQKNKALESRSEKAMVNWPWEPLLGKALT